MITLIIFSLLLAYWLRREIYLFPIRINLETYKDYHMTFEAGDEVSLETFLDDSQLQPTTSRLPALFMYIFPLCCLLFSDLSGALAIIFCLLIYLSLLDYYYYLTDTKYLFMIFALSLWYLVIENPLLLTQNMPSLLGSVLFLLFFIPFINLLFKKEMMGTGDTLLLVALSPLFSLEQMLFLLLCSSLCGLICFAVYYLIRKEKLAKIPFIPCISFAVLVLFIPKLLP